VDELQGLWCFRGQRESSWSLTTSLDRAVKVEYVRRDVSGCYHLDREAEERDLLLRFRQQAHNHIRHLPSIDDLGGWLALMQHHRVPTRLLDWTQSPYVAMYFALEDEPQESCSGVWAIDLHWLQTKAPKPLGSEGSISALEDVQGRAERVNGLLRQTEKPVIVQIDPLGTNERMLAQQGTFLCKLYHQASFSQILMTMMIDPDMPHQPVLRKLEIEKGLRIKLLKNLRQMGIHSASLFPGFDGFAKSLKLDLEIKVKEAGA
jgi:hypothetical protein